MKVSVRIEGVKQLDAALGTLTKATARNTLIRVLRRAAEPLDERWRSLAPELSGALKRSGGIMLAGKLARNEAFATAMRENGGDLTAARRQTRETLRASAGDRAFAEIAVGPGKLAQATLAEFGTSTASPRPYFRPAWDATKDGALAGIADDLAAEIAKAAARAARKAARAAAKG